MIHRFDETALTQALANLPIAKAAAFAAAVTTRQIANYEHCASALDLTSPSRYREITAQLWELILSDDLNTAGWDALLEEVMDMFASESLHQWLRVALVEDAVSSLAYSINFILDHDAQHASWAARRAYEITDQVTIAKFDLVPNDPLSENSVLSDVIVQRELGRQSRDMKLLGNGFGSASIRDLHDVAHSETALTHEELALIDTWQRPRQQ